MAQSITRMVPILRNQGGQVAGAWPLASWCDSVLLGANTNYAYLLKTDAGNNKGSILRINCVSAVNPLYVDAEKAAAVPTGDQVQRRYTSRQHQDDRARDPYRRGARGRGLPDSLPLMDASPQSAFLPTMLSSGS